MKALVTGGGGFLGRYVVEQLLARGDEAIVFTRGTYPELVEEGAVLIRGDLQDAAAIRDACAGVQVVYHVAAKTGHWGSYGDYYQANVVGTQNVIAACRAAGVPRLVFTSSPSVVFDGRPHEGADESLPYPARYESPYPRTKAMAERLVREVDPASGLRTVTLRPHLVFGPRDNHLLPGIIARAHTGKLPQVGDGHNRADLTYVEDAARAHLLAADALRKHPSIAGGVYFVSQDDPVNVWSWLNDLFERLGLPRTRHKLPLWAVRAAGGALELAYRALPLRGEPFITRFTASETAMSHYYDISRAKRDLGYRPQFSMGEALERTIPYLERFTR
jgi:nucleoside-diphosphate-sugar epimerase